MRLVIHDYKEHCNTVVHDEVKRIEDNYHDGVTVTFESGRYLCIPSNQYSYIELYTISDAPAYHKRRKNEQ